MTKDVVDPKLDLVLERVVDVPPELVWKAWTTPEHIVKWFTPRPWTTPECEIDLRPGGKFRTKMRGPNGEEFDNMGCFLEVVAPRRLVWTSALLPGFRPSPGRATGPDVPFTAILTFAPHGAGTRYIAHAMHKDEPGRKVHEDMGFHHGWGLALDQLVEVMTKVSSP